jgi:CRP/FNR family transcriptional activator FtrB
MRIKDLEETRSMPLFSGVAVERVESMLKASFLQRFPACVELIREGEPADFLHIVVDGQVELFSCYRERETTVAVLGPGKSFIAAAVLLDRIYLKSARALAPSRILMVPADAVRCQFQEDGAFARSMAIELALAYRGLVKELKNQKLRSGLERLANWLLAHHAQMGAPARFELPFDKKVLASRLGMAPEVLSRSFAALAPYSVLVDGAFVQLCDLAALTKLAHPTVTIDDLAS